LHRLSIALVSLLLLLGLSPPVAASGLFGTQEIYSTNLAPFGKWDGVVDRAEREREDSSSFCRTQPAGQPCVAEWWRSFIVEISRLPLRERVARVNDTFNRVAYVPAQTNWHDPDHWETPFEFLTRGGQCQDYAIAKFMALEQSGVPQADLRFAVVRDTVKSADHAVAIVTVDGEALVLDNQNTAIVSASPQARYRLYYSINRIGWWYPLPESGKGVQIARSSEDSQAR
jgi:predicted transglutaminase-like cysteine proteinase